MKPQTRKVSARVVVYYIAYPQRMAGANRSLFELVTNLPKPFQPVVLSVREGRVTRAYREAGIEVVVAEPGPRLSEFGKAALGWTEATKVDVFVRELLPYTGRLRRVLKALRPAIVHTNDPRGTMLIGLAAKSLGLPVVGHLRGEIPFGGVLARAYEAIPNRFVAVSEATRAELSPPARTRATAVYNGTRDVSDRGQPVAWMNHLRDQGVVVASVFASVVPFKGLHHMIRAVAELNRRGVGERLAVVCVGDLDSEPRAYVDWVRGLLHDHGVYNVTFAGWQDDPFSFYRSSDVSVLPSVSDETLQYAQTLMRVRGNEGFPRTHLEAMCFGLPIVGTDIAGVREQVVDGETGFVVPPSDPVALADALERLVQDPGLRRRLGEQGRERVLDRFSTDAYVKGVVRVYEALTGAPS